MPTIAYIMSRFPHLPETFILREMNELERSGQAIALYPLVVQHQAVVHTTAQPWLKRVQRQPFISIETLFENGRTLFSRPRTWGAVWGQALWENRTHSSFFLRALSILPRAASTARHMRQAGVRHIHAHYASHPALLAWAIHRLTGISYSVTVHAHDIFVRHEMLRPKLGEAAFIAAISEFNRDYLTRLLGPEIRQRIEIVRCGITPEAYHPISARPVAGGSLEIISIGSLQPYKGQRHLIDACAQLQKRQIPFRCRIIGGGEERARLENQISLLGLTGQVELLGPQPENVVAQLLATAHCYAQPSIITPSGKMEGIPVALMEALACGLPVVASELSGIPELVRPDQTGYLVPPTDAKALADALAHIYRSPEQALQLGQAGRELVLRDFNLTANVAKLRSLFERTLATT